MTKKWALKCLDHGAQTNWSNMIQQGVCIYYYLTRSISGVNHWWVDPDRNCTKYRIPTHKLGPGRETRKVIQTLDVPLPLECVASQVSSWCRNTRVLLCCWEAAFPGRLKRRESCHRDSCLAKSVTDSQTRMRGCSIDADSQTHEDSSIHVHSCMNS